MPLPAAPFPTATADQMAQVDRIMFDDLGLDILQVMEVAGLAVARFARARFLGGDPRAKRVLVLAGPGGNGGDGLVAARYLLGWGAAVVVVLARERAALGQAAAHQARVLDRLGLPLVVAGLAHPLPETDLVLDALLGFGLNGDPQGPTADLIRAANGHPAPILAVDVPSGLDATNGAAYSPCLRATATLTLALPKRGLLVPTAAPVVGELHVADIGVPAAAYARLDLHPGPLFAQADTIRLR